MQGNITDWGKEVKKGLIERGWSINDLAERIGKSRTRVSGVVNGRIYSDSIASAISDLLNIEKASASMKEATRDWCMDARKAMIDLDMNTAELAEKTGYSTQYLNAIICGRCYSPPVHRAEYTLTTAIATQQEYMQALNAAYMKVTSGAFSYQEAIRQAIRDAAVKGTSVMYDSGYISKLDTAIRTALLTGVNQTAGKLTELYASELGAEYYETTAHAGARPSHSVWQGKVFKIEGTAPGYENFYEATGYGTGAGLCGWNCRHSFYPYWPGVSKPAYTKDDLEDYSRPKHSFAGNLLTEYECMQKQREYERAVREYKRILAAYDSYIQTVQSEADRAYFREEFQKESVKLKEKESQMKDFCKQTGRSVDTARTQVSAVYDGNGNLVSFNRSVSGKAVWANKKAK